MKDSGKPELSGVCVIGRDEFSTGIGRVALAALELLSRYYDVSLYPVNARAAHPGKTVVLPTGREIPIASQPSGFAVYFFTDVLWNGVRDYNYAKVPEEGLRIAHVAYDSNELPPEWVRILNTRFDLVMFTSAHLLEVAQASGVRIPTMTLPVGLELETLIDRRYVSPVADFKRFGTISAFHERKGLDLLVQAYIQEFGARTDVELVIHSNLAIGDAHSRVAALIAKCPGARIVLSHGKLSEAEKNDLIDSFDVYVTPSSGEGYSIGPREALALGKSVVLSRIPPHEELAGVAGTFLIESDGKVGARYPEIDNRVFGMADRFQPSAIAAAMRAAFEYLATSNSSADADARKALAAKFSMTALAQSYARVIDPDLETELRSREFPPTVVVPTEIDQQSRALSARFGRSLGTEKIVVPMRDAGFFSIFNTFMTHLTWSIRDNRTALVLPDWDARRLIERSTEPIINYCYSPPDAGNMWLSLFEPLYGLSAEEMNDSEFLYDRAVIPGNHHNTRREPLLTFVNAFDLYQAPWFRRFRNQYNSAFRDFVRLRPELRAELDTTLANSFGGRFTIAAHVKHPSHATEQPGQLIAGVDEYAETIREVLRSRQISESSDDWRLFVATDQDRVVLEFQKRYGERVVRFDDVARVSVEEQDKFDALDQVDKLRDGHQLQHLMAVDTSRWSSRLAWEVWRDAEAMASSDVLIHAVSNVATAASYLGTKSEMIYCEPAALAG
jgi:glycosyltransferase involved in cell wall biosynthesis